MNNIDTANNFFEETMRQILESEAPMKKIQLNKKHKSWLSPSTRKLIIERNNVRELARVNHSAATWLEYKKIRNTVTAECRKDKRKHFEKNNEKCESSHDTKSLYKVTKQQLGWNSGDPLDSFLINGRQITAPKEMANVQN